MNYKNPEPPPGFQLLEFGGPFMAHNGPIFRSQKDGRVRLGFRVDKTHVNPMGTCHGGMLASFCDTLLLAIAHFTPSNLKAAYFPTIGLQIDYLDAAPMGSWIEGEGEILRSSGSLVFIQAIATADGKPCVRTSGTFKAILPR